MEYLRLFKSITSTRYLIRRVQNRFVAGFLKNKSFETVVDIGAGRAPYKKFVKCNKYIAIDKENRGAANDLILADINSGIPLPDESVDLIIMTEVLEHVKKPAEVIKDAYRILRKGGIIILTTPMTWPIHERPNDFFRYTQFGLEYLLKEAGFKEFKINASNGFIYTILQLINSVLRNKIFYPLVMVINLLGVIIFKTKLDFYYDLPLGYQVIAFKSKTK